MKSRRPIIFVIIPFFLMILLHIAEANSIAVIVNKDNSEAVDIDKLKRIYLKMVKFWLNGKEIAPVELESSSEGYNKFIQKVLNKTPQEITAFWIQRAITDNLKRPLILKSDKQIIEFIKKVPTAIGYVDKKNVDDSVRMVLEIN